MRINHNINALNAWRNLGDANNGMGKSLEKLSSGLRINRAGDDAAGLAISEKMRAQIRGLDQGTRNAQDGISLIQTAEGALTETHSMLQRMRELSVQAATDTNTGVDRGALQDEVKQLQKEVDRIANTTQFNKKNLLNGELGIDVTGNANVDLSGVELVDASGNAVSSGTVNFQVSSATVTIINSTSDIQVTSSITLDYSLFEGNLESLSTSTDVTLTNDQTISVGDVDVTLTAGTVVGATASATYAVSTANFGETAGLSIAAANFEDKSATLKIGANEGNNENMTVTIRNMNAESLSIDNVDISTRSGAEAAITIVDNAIASVSDQRSALGAVQNRLEHTINNLSVSSENLTAAESRIRDVDMAREMMKFTKQQILMQTSNSMLAQANQIPQNVLQLLR
jgi:flagellin